MWPSWTSCWWRTTGLRLSRSTPWGTLTIPEGTAAAASKWQLNVTDFPFKGRHDSRQEPWTAVIDGLPSFISSECLTTAGRFHETLRPYYQQSLDVPGHMATDWEDWLQVCVSLNAQRPQPPDVTFPADTRKKILNSDSVFHDAFDIFSSVRFFVVLFF